MNAETIKKLLHCRKRNDTDVVDDIVEQIANVFDLSQLERFKVRVGTRVSVYKGIGSDSKGVVTSVSDDGECVIDFGGSKTECSVMNIDTIPHSGAEHFELYEITDEEFYSK